MASACGGGGSSSGGGASPGIGGTSSGVGGDDSVGGGGTSANGGSGGNIFGEGGSGDGTCQPATCEAQGKGCGIIADGCGNTIDCGGCGDGEVCGLGEANVCAGIDDVCVRVSQEVACEGKQCGLVGDGCGNTIDCGSCPDGQSCGLTDAYQCAQIPGGSDTECAARIPSCASQGVTCGVIGNGCGGLIDCDAELGGCSDGELCGADVDLGQVCAPFDACIPLDPAVACANTCGIVSNGCGPEVDGGVINCQDIPELACTAPDTCGGGGVQNQCGHDGTAVSCTPVDQAVACANRDCGFVADGCGTAWDCSGGNDCDNGSQCVNGTCTAIAGCTLTPKVQACNNKECGSVSDGCGGSYDCGSCTGNEECGARTAFQCDIPPQVVGDPDCVAFTQQQACGTKECGVAYDGCGTTGIHVFNCGSNDGACPGGEFCGAQAAYQCDPMPTPPACVPNGKTCDSEGWACGTFVNNCGTTEDCGDCAASQTCMGGISSPTTCVSVAGNGGADCPLCDAVPACASNELTRLTGRVIAPGQDDSKTANQVRVPNAFVYILRTNDTADLPAIGTGLPSNDGLSCDRCDDQDLGAVLVGDVTDANGDWTLEGNIPVGEEFLLITKVGKFRRAQRMTLPAGAACTTTNLSKVMSTAGSETAGQGTGDNPTRLPRNMSDGLAVNIPRMAITTGRIDAMECVFYKMGIAQSEFGNFSANGTNRIDLYRGASSSSPEGASIDANTPHDSALYTDLSRLEKYDMVVSDCEGSSWDSSFTQRGDGTDTSQGGKVRQYVNRGGRMFLSHLSFSWIHQNGTTAYSGTSAATERATGLGQSSTWFTTANTNTIGTGVISLVGTRPQVSPRIQTFADWMVNETVTTSPGYAFTITDPRSQNNTIAAGTEEFVYRADAPPATTTQGYSNSGNGRIQQFSFNTPFGAPDSAACGRVAYSGFHVAATGGGQSPFQTATFPSHCTDALANNGNLTAQEKILLFMLFDLGTCVGDEPEPPACTPVDCGDDQCGVVSDGCGGTQNCGGCAADQICSNNVCELQCVPTTCAEQGIACSTIADGCGGTLTCPCNVCQPVTQQAACANKCGYQSDGCSGVYFCGTCPNSCVPATACPTGVNCGTIGDGCNGTLNCGDTCPNGQVCGAYDPNVCAPPTCRPLECYEIEGIECGIVGDGCGNPINCGECAPGQICTVVGGHPNRCAGCTPKSQQTACAGLECGQVGDGCGGVLNCGTCTTQGEFCGALTPNMCDPGPQCVPQACPSGAECGVMGNGCGGTVNCGTCPAGQLCGVYEPYKCGGCTPQTCEQAGAQCGTVGNGCGGELDCGECAAGYICGLGQANRCGQLR